MVLYPWVPAGPDHGNSTSCRHTKIKSSLLNFADLLVFRGFSDFRILLALANISDSTIIILTFSRIRLSRYSWDYIVIRFYLLLL